LAQPDIPERVINADPDNWYRGDPEVIGQENHDEWRSAVRNPQVVRAMLEDYRAGLSVDREHEEADRAAGRRVQSPLLVLGSKKDDLEDLHVDPLSIWRSWADDVRGYSIESGHHMAEEAPGSLATALGDFFRPD
jgi:haloacetate dehalogenase